MSGLINSEVFGDLVIILIRYFVVLQVQHKRCAISSFSSKIFKIEFQINYKSDEDSLPVVLEQGRDDAHRQACGAGSHFTLRLRSSTMNIVHRIQRRMPPRTYYDTRHCARESHMFREQWDIYTTPRPERIMWGVHNMLSWRRLAF